MDSLCSKLTQEHVNLWITRVASWLCVTDSQAHSVTAQLLVPAQKINCYQRCLRLARLNRETWGIQGRWRHLWWIAYGAVVAVICQSFLIINVCEEKLWTEADERYVTPSHSLMLAPVWCSASVPTDLGGPSSLQTAGWLTGSSDLHAKHQPHNNIRLMLC